MTRITKEQRAAQIAALKAEAARRMEGFEYTCLAKTDQIEAWHCQKPGTGVYHFDITVLRSGMSVTGDIDGMLFNVGASYGFPFLLQEDKGYVAQKLEQQCRVNVFDQEAFDDALAGLVANKVNAILPEDSDERAELARAAGLSLPEWIGDADHPSLTLDAVTEWVDDASHNKFIGTNHGDIDGIEDQLDDLVSKLEEAQYLDNAIRAHDFLSENEGYFDTADTWEWRLECLAPELIQRLYMLDHAATQIMAIKAKSAQEPAVAA